MGVMAGIFCQPDERKSVENAYKDSKNEAECSHHAGNTLPVCIDTSTSKTVSNKIVVSELEFVYFQAGVLNNGARLSCRVSRVPLSDAPIAPARLGHK